MSESQETKGAADAGSADGIWLKREIGDAKGPAPKRVDWRLLILIQAALVVGVVVILRWAL
jgi:hypothetical protein